MHWQTELETGLAAVRQAARVCAAVQAAITPDTLAKKDNSPVTVADWSSQAIICRALEQRFPDDPVIGEEDAVELRQPENAPFLDRIQAELEQVGIKAGGEQICGWIDRGGCSKFTQRFWTLDPIDGTKGFLRREQYAVSLALIVAGRIELGILGCPNLPFRNGGGSLLYAIRGGGAYCLPLHDLAATPERIAVSAMSDISQARFCESVESGHSSHSDSARLAERLGITAEPVRMDSQAKYAVVARGEAEIYLRLPTRPGYVEKIWDHAGGVLVVQEAGGSVTDVHGQPLDFTCGRGLEKNQGVIVTSGPFQQAVLSGLGSGG